MAQHETISGWKARAYLLCDQAASVRSVRAGLADANQSVPESEIAAALDDLVTRRLMITERGRYLSLAIPESQPK